jgi:multicomponent Na+:H+ antiporter subunit D
VYRSQPAVAVLALIPLFSLAGVPPLSGFVAKVAVLAPMITGGYYWLAAIALAVSLLTLLSVARLWDESFWKPAPAAASASAPHARYGVLIVAPVALLVTLTVAVTVAAGPLLSLTTRAAQQLLHSDAYVRAVLGDGGQSAAR